MNFALLCLVLLCAVLVVQAEEAVGGDNMSATEIQELINGYKDLNNNDGQSAPVSWFVKIVLLNFWKWVLNEF